MLNINRKDNITTIALTHGKVNVMDLELCQAVTEAFKQEGNAAGIILTGEGPAFSAGVDLFRMVKGGSSYGEEFITALVDMFMSVFNFQGPVVAAINGHAIAGGCVIAACCDHRIMHSGKGRIGIPELHVGVPFPVEGLEILRFILPNRFLSEVVYTGGTWLAEDALQRGIVDAVCEAEELMPTAEAAVHHMASVNRAVFSATKQQLHHPVLQAIDGMQHLNDQVTAYWKEPSTHQMLGEYLERTMKKG